MTVKSKKSPKRKTPAKAPATTSPVSTPAGRAIASIVAYHNWKKSLAGTLYPGWKDAPAELNLEAVANIISPGLEPGDLLPDQLCVLLTALKGVSDHNSAHGIRKVVAASVETRWQQFAPVLRDIAAEMFQESYLQHDLDHFLDQWPRLKSDPTLLTHVLDALASDSVSVSPRLRSLQKLTGTLADAQRLLTICLAPTARVDPDELASDQGFVGRCHGSSVERVLPLTHGLRAERGGVEGCPKGG